MYFYVYRIICKHPETLPKYYYGVRQCECLPQEDNQYWSRSQFVAAARKQLGQECFYKKIVSVYPTRFLAISKEIRLHSFFNLKAHPFFFNKANQISTRFVPGPLSSQGRAKISAALLGNQHTLGRPHDPETRKKIAKAMKGKKNSLGKSLSFATRKKISQARAGLKPFLGKRHSAATRAKISCSRAVQAKKLDVNDIEKELIFVKNT